MAKIRGIKLVYDLRALKALKKATGVDPIADTESVMSVDHIGALVWAGMLRNQPDAKIEDLDDLSMHEVRDAMEAIGEAFSVDGAPGDAA